MGRMSREKGKRGEREVRDVFRAAGITDAVRAGHRQVQADDKTPDVVTVAGLHMEVKRQERLCIAEWVRQAEADAALTGAVPAVAYRQNNQPWRVVVPLAYLAALVARANGDAR